MRIFPEEVLPKLTGFRLSYYPSRAVTIEKTGFFFHTLFLKLGIADDLSSPTLTALKPPGVTLDRYSTGHIHALQTFPHTPFPIPHSPFPQNLNIAPELC